jgi:hypothetical protein
VELFLFLFFSHAGCCLQGSDVGRHDFSAGKSSVRVRICVCVCEIVYVAGGGSGVVLIKTGAGVVWI